MIETTVNNPVYTRNRIHPKKFALLVACASMVMMFAGLTSAYLVRQAAGNWLEFTLPNLFYYSTAVIVSSSLALHGSYLLFRRGNAVGYKSLMVLAMVLALTFIVLQYQGWLALAAGGVELTTNPSGSFVYVISGLHAAHVLGGIAAIGVALLHAFLLPFRPTERRKLRFELTLIFWHFVDLLWIYLFIFLAGQ
ncbi:MAG: cytochrome c oxidase subunit 3 [Lewinellaceae bacterium]|nr:cytochrome c oxidase subunit 3 [Lewinellaceae bacterium]